ncbi:transmembrane protein 100 [Engraulis encrasicolus]|uniref:transmembrane protein 100 n=1 Tax=Engraulis encrasicolus TaxID=184585 RepID=UPI002FD615FB
MGCTAGHPACQAPPAPNTATLGPGCGGDGEMSDSAAAAAATAAAESLEEGRGTPKSPEVLSSLERLSQATGGMEKSWYRCIFPFGIFSLVIGIAGTGVTYTYDALPQTKVVSLVLLVVGVVLVAMAVACWTAHKKKRRKKKEKGDPSSSREPELQSPL